MRSTGQVFCFIPYSWNFFHAFFSIKLRLWFVERKITGIKCHSFILWKVHYIKMTYHCWSPGWGRVFSGFFLKKICMSMPQSCYISYLRFFYMKELPILHHSFINSIIYLCHFWTDVILLCCCLVAKSCLTFCNPKDCSMPGFPVLYHLLYLAHTHVHWVRDAFQTSHPLLLTSLVFPIMSLFQWVSSSHQVAKVLELQLQHWSFQWIFRVDFLYNWLVWSSCCPTDSQESSPAAQFKSIDSLALSLLSGPTLTSIHDYWKNYRFKYRELCW